MKKNKFAIVIGLILLTFVLASAFAQAYSYAYDSGQYPNTSRPLASWENNKLEIYSLEARGNGPYSTQPNLTQNNYADIRVRVLLVDESFKDKISYASDGPYVNYYSSYGYNYYPYESYNSGTYFYPSQNFYGNGYYDGFYSYPYYDYGNNYVTERTEGRQKVTAKITVNGKQLYSISKYVANGEIAEFEWTNIKVDYSFSVSALIVSENGLTDSESISGVVEQNQNYSNNQNQLPGQLPTINSNVYTSGNQVMTSNANFVAMPEKNQPEAVPEKNLVISLQGTPTTTYIYDNPLNQPGSCSDIQLVAKDLGVKGNAYSYPIIEIMNNGNANFIVDSVLVSENDNAFTASVDKYPNSINGQASNNITLQLKGNDSKNEVYSNLNVRVKGKFANGIECSPQAINKNYQVLVEPTAFMQNYCAGFKLTTPSSVDLIIVNYAIVKVQALNQTNKPVTVNVRGFELNSSPSQFVVNPNTNKEQSIRIEAKQYGKKGLILEPKADECYFESKSVTVNVSQALSQYFGNGIVLVDVAEKIELWDAKKIGFIVKNNTNETKKLRILLDGLPNDWFVISQEMEIPTFQTKLIEVVVQPGKTKAKINANVLLNYDSLDHPTKSISFNAAPEFGNKALEVLSSVKNISTGNERKFEVELDITNKTDYTFDGRIDIKVDEGWLIDGQTFIVLPSQQSTKVKLLFTATANAPVDSVAKISISDESGNVLVDRFVVLGNQNNVNGVLVGFASLGKIGLNIILILGIGLLIYLILNKIRDSNVSSAKEFFYGETREMTSYQPSKKRWAVDNENRIPKRQSFDWNRIKKKTLNLEDLKNQLEK